MTGPRKLGIVLLLLATAGMATIAFSSMDIVGRPEGPRPAEALAAAEPRVPIESAPVEIAAPTNRQRVPAPAVAAPVLTQRAAASWTTAAQAIQAELFAALQKGDPDAIRSAQARAQALASATAAQLQGQAPASREH